MKVSLNTIKQFIDFELPPVAELAATVNAQLGGIEEIIDLHDKYKDAVIVKVVECEKHANADKLSVCMIDAGDCFKELRAEGTKLIQVVCGAPNVHAGMWAIWLPPGATVPASYGDKSPFVLDVREIRGVKSHGMLAAADELGIGTDHAGIIELTDSDLTSFGSTKHLAAGQNFAEVFGLDDTVIDIENKMFTHRPDLFGQLGVAREMAGILDRQFTSPKWYAEHGEAKAAASAEKNKKLTAELPLQVENTAGEVVPRYMAAMLNDVEIKPSPMWLQCELVRLGSKPINNVVDVTNYVMLLTAQPTHAYDYDKLRGHQISARHAKKGETVKLLNGKTYELDPADIVIADSEGPIGLGGIMGGGNSEVSKSTKHIVLEVANFDMYTSRRSAMRHGVFTDALTRFTKGQSPLQNAVIMDLLIKSVLDVAGGTQDSEIFDLWGKAVKTKKQEITISSNFINERLGLKLSASRIQKLLGNVEVLVRTQKSGDMSLVPPFWRTDIEQSEDVVEEIGRLYGFDKLPLELPKRTAKPVVVDKFRQVKSRLRFIMKRLGANEVLTYSFVHENVLKRAEQDPKKSYALSNALSPELQYYRQSVLPSLLDKVHANIKSGHDEFVLYEIGKGHDKAAVYDDMLPRERHYIDAVYASKTARSDAPYYFMQRLLLLMGDELGLTIACRPLSAKIKDFHVEPFDSSRSAEVVTMDGVVIGVVGELKASVITNFKLPKRCAAISLDIEKLGNALAASVRNYEPLSKYPPVTQDISFKVAPTTTFESVASSFAMAVEEYKSDNVVRITPLAVYQPTTEGDKTISLRIRVVNYDKTLNDKAVSKLLAQAADVVIKQTGATVV